VRGTPQVLCSSGAREVGDKKRDVHRGGATSHHEENDRGKGISSGVVEKFCPVWSISKKKAFVRRSFPTSSKQEKETKKRSTEKKKEEKKGEKKKRREQGKEPKGRNRTKKPQEERSKMSQRGAPSFSSPPENGSAG